MIIQFPSRFKSLGLVKGEMYHAAKIANPEITDEEFESSWAEFEKTKAAEIKRSNNESRTYRGPRGSSGDDDDSDAA